MVAGNNNAEIRNDPVIGEWLSRKAFMEKTGVSERTLTNRIKNNYYVSRFTVENGREILYSYAAHHEMLAESAKNNTGNALEDIAGNNSRKTEADPEMNFRQERKLSLLDPEFSRNGVCEECYRYQGRVQLLEEQLRAVEIANAKLEGQMDGKDALLSERDRVVDSLKETVTAKDQSVNATQAAYLKLQEQLENTRPALPASASGMSGNGSPEARKNIFHRLLDAVKQ